MKPIFEMLAAYNAWANERLCGAVKKLPGRLAGLSRRVLRLHPWQLNHILLGDRIWMHAKPTQLDAMCRSVRPDARTPICVNWSQLW
jgi:uncharacterized damage-inducible protein DinB